MASCNMASAASGFGLTPNVTSNTTSGARSYMLSFPFKNNTSSRLIVRAAEEGAPPATTTAPVEGEAPKPKPPPIGPKRGTKVSTQSSVSFHCSYEFFANQIGMWKWVIYPNQPYLKNLIDKKKKKKLWKCLSWHLLQGYIIHAYELYLNFFSGIANCSFLVILTFIAN